jgi:hypothetical protein
MKVVKSAAASECTSAIRLPGNIVELHRHTDDLVALLGEERRRHGGIDAAGHCNYNPHPSKLKCNHEKYETGRTEVLRHNSCGTGL